MNCYTVILSGHDSEGDFRVIAKDYDGNRVFGRQWSGEKFDAERQVGMQHLADADVEVMHFFRSVRTTYNGLKDFAWGEITKTPQRVWMKQRVQQWRFNLTARFRNDRIKILSFLIDSHIKSVSDDTFFDFERKRRDSLHIFKEMYGDLVFGHPKVNTELAKFELMLDSLTASGDLSKTYDGYALEGNALKTIADFELEERRHRDSKRHSSWLVVLTAVLALTAIFSVFFE